EKKVKKWGSKDKIKNEKRKAYVRTGWKSCAKRSGVPTMGRYPPTRKASLPSVQRRHRPLVIKH
ncbi:MAG TPA: hypothetical protein VK970_09990, partial [Candidatus Methylacidiphilales bacterium]|nr:hypothetical protein [Candidatus Methylacidiphilales bacterium]